MKFITDHMLGKLAKYLRLLGYDTVYPEKPLDDDTIIDLARREERILLSRDRELCSRYQNSLLIKSDNYIEQLKEVVSKYGLRGEMILTRCSICNVNLIQVEKDTVKGIVPEHVYSMHDEFYKCPKCGRIYWMGTHTNRIVKTLKMVLENEN